MKSRMRWLAIAMCVTMLAACSRDPKEQQAKLIEQGKAYFDKGLYPEAAIEFRRAVQADPKSGAAHYQLARTYLAQQQWPLAYKELTAAVELDPKNFDAQVNLAELLLGAGQFGAAQDAAKKVLGVDPDNADALVVLGKKYAATHDVASAIEEFQKAIQLKPANANNYIGLAGVYVSAGKKTEAEATYKKAIEADPKSVTARLALSSFYFYDRRVAEAESVLQSAIQVDPRSPLPRLALAQVYTTQGKLPEAENVYQELKQAVSGNPQAYRALGRFYWATGQTDKAVAEFKALAGSHPQDITNRKYLTAILIDANRIDEAAQVEQDILKESPKDTDAMLLGGRILLAQGKNQEASQKIQEFLKSEPNSAEGYYYLGVAQNAIGASNEAKDAWQRALQLQPGLPRAQLALASLDLKSRNYADAMRLADETTKTNPSLAGSYLIRAEALMNQGKLKEAEVPLQLALEREPTSVAALTTLVNLYGKENRANQALQKVASLIQQFPQSGALYYLQGVAYSYAKQFAQSQASLRKAIQLQPKNLDAYTLLAQLDLALGSEEKSKQDLQAAVDQHLGWLPEYMLGNLLDQEGNWQPAEKLYEQAHQLNPSSPDASTNLARLYLDHGGNVNIAMSLVQAAKRQAPDSPEVSDTLGWADYKMGVYDAAVAELQRCVAKAPSNAACQYHLGLSYMATAQRDQAKQALEKTLSLDPQSPYASGARAKLAKIAESPLLLPQVGPPTD